MKVAVVHKFKQRGYAQRFSQKTYQVEKVLSDAVPIGYRISGHGARLFYKEELIAVDTPSVASDGYIGKRKVLGIISEKKFPVKWLRSGKAIQYQTKYLIRTSDKSQTFYATEQEVIEYENGPAQLEAHKARRHG